ncbi:MAG TPA: ferrochelatase [Chthoniobacteraceae bacterium]|nr:ferrochelatase [Chthoniobacteraceae bacterium]
MKRKAVLLVNLGSPDSPAVPDVRRYLREFLMDGRVIDAPWPIRFGIVHFTILPKRPHASSHAYQSIWTEEGSPLIVISQRLRAALQARVEIPVELAMRYRNPSIAAAVRKLAGLGTEELLLIPLFPHYAMSSYETAVEAARAELARNAPSIRLRVAPPYYDAPDYLHALSESAAPFLEEPFDHLLFSFHGLPERHLRKADPTGSHCLKTANCCEAPSPAHATCYRAQCLATVRAFLARQPVPKAKVSVAFQSRLGKEPWMLPYTDREIARRARAGVKRLVILSPAFVADCLETLEELGIQGRNAFLEAGGERFTLVPCLNDHPLWVTALQRMVTDFTGSPCGETEDLFNSFLQK